MNPFILMNSLIMLLTCTLTMIIYFLWSIQYELKPFILPLLSSLSLSLSLCCSLSLSLSLCLSLSLRLLNPDMPLQQKLLIILIMLLRIDMPTLLHVSTNYNNMKSFHSTLSSILSFISDMLTYNRLISISHHSM